jgi:hypothetical protein
MPATPAAVNGHPTAPEEFAAGLIITCRTGSMKAILRRRASYEEIETTEAGHEHDQIQRGG